MRLATIPVLTTLLLPVLALSGSAVWAQDADDWRQPSRAVAVAYDEACEPPTEVEASRAELAVQVLQSFPRSSDMFDASMGVFGTFDKGQACLPDTLKQRIIQATAKAEAWSYGLAGPTRLGLARRLGGRDPTMIQDIAQSAFHAGPIDDLVSTDIRPEARSVLASFGSAAAPWRDEAFKLMHARDSLGTSAAQVAAASRDPKAVEAVARLLRDQLDTGSTKLIKHDRAKQVVELAYALGAAGEAARPWTGVLLDLLGHEIESLAPPFGIIARPPTEVCRALQRIGGAEAEVALQTDQCKKPWSLLPG